MSQNTISVSPLPQ